MRLPRIRHFLPVLAPALLLWPPPPASAQEEDPIFRSGWELAAIGATSVGLLAVGSHVADFEEPKPSLWETPPDWEVALSRRLGGEPRPGKRNFLDDFFGAAVTPGVAASIILATDLAYPIGSGHRVFTQDLALFASGVAANKGITDFFKGWVARPRPLTHLAPELAAADTAHGTAYQQSSFFSGHTSAAFFAVTFLARHTRDAMQREMSPEAFDRWSWLPSVVGYGWASYVGLSRIQAQRHYLTDVAVGAAAGFLVGTLFYSLANDIRDPEDGSGGSPPLAFGMSWRF